MHMVSNARRLASDEYVPWKAKNLHKSYINTDIKIMNKNGNESLETW